MTDFIKIDGYPCEFVESAFGKPLVEAIEALPGADALTPDDVEAKARMLYHAAQYGRDEELPRNRPASQKASEDELRKLAALAIKLERHIKKMRQPAVSALYSEGAHVFELARLLEQVQEDARRAFNSLGVGGSPGGAPEKIAAKEVAFLAARTFETVTGQRASFTSDPSTSEVTGDWPEFLAAVYAALHIQASVAAQARALSAKTPQKIGINLT